jgi:hypothetical protein
VYDDRLGYADPVTIHNLLLKETGDHNGMCLFNQRIQAAQERTGKKCMCNISELIDCNDFRGIDKMPSYMLCQFICEHCLAIFKRWNNGVSVNKADVLMTFEACASEWIKRLHAY